MTSMYCSVDGFPHAYSNVTMRSPGVCQRENDRSSFNSRVTTLSLLEYQCETRCSGTTARSHSSIRAGTSFWFFRALRHFDVRSASIRHRSIDCDSGRVVGQLATRLMFPGSFIAGGAQRQAMSPSREARGTANSRRQISEPPSD